MKHCVARLWVRVGVLSQVRWAGDGVVAFIINPEMINLNSSLRAKQLVYLGVSQSIGLQLEVFDE
jgi:hypothetical protein